MEEKSKEKRLEEAEKLKAEEIRATAAAKAKLAHAEIESIEKTRKHSAVSSITMRIQTHVSNITKLQSIIVEVMKKYPFIQPPFITISGKNLVETYKSIREDFKSVMDISDERMNKLFPERDTSFRNMDELGDILLGISEQETQILAYLMRMIR